MRLRLLVPTFRHVVGDVIEVADADAAADLIARGAATRAPGEERSPEED